MRAFRVLLITALTVLLLGATAYGAGYAVKRLEAPSATSPAGTTTPTPATPTSPPPSASTPEPTTPAVARWQLRAGDRGEQVRELQHRLYQLGWLPEATTGRYDHDTVAAVAGFQDRRGLRATGRIDQRTWRVLLRMTRQPSQDQLHNVWHAGPPLLAVGASGDRVRAVQARLKEIAWYFGDVTGRFDRATVRAVRGFQAKREIPVTGAVDRRTLDRLTAMTTVPTHDAMYNIEPEPGALDARCRTGRVLCIDKTSRTLRWVVDGTVRTTLEARFGSTLNDTPTREGLFHVYLKSRDHVSKLYGSSMPFAMFFSGGQAVHYSSDFAAVGYNGASHGCVNIRDYDKLAWLFDQVRVGDTVVVYWS